MIPAKSRPRTPIRGRNPEGWQGRHQSHPNTLGDQFPFSYLGVPVVTGMRDFYFTPMRVTFSAQCGSIGYEGLYSPNGLRETLLRNISDLVSRAQAGDLASYEEIVRRFQAWAFSRAFSILGDSHLAEDAVQDAFVEAFRNLGSLLAPEAFPSWFQRIVLTACNRITRKRALPASSLDEAQISQRTDLDPSDRIEREERDRMVHIAIQSLSDNLRMVTALYFIGGMSQREVGDYLCLSETVVKKRLFDARRKLRGYLTNMAKSISDERMPAEEISARVIAELISRPQPLLIKITQSGKSSTRSGRPFPTMK